MKRINSIYNPRVLPSIVRILNIFCGHLNELIKSNVVILPTILQSEKEVKLLQHVLKSNPKLNLDKKLSFGPLQK